MSGLDDLEARSVSGIDLCGNGVVIVPGEWYVRRTGQPNPFRAEGVIKNVYRRSSSVVARLFLARPEFDSVQDALEELRRRGGRVTLPTVSKVCRRLEDDLIIERKGEGDQAPAHPAGEAPRPARRQLLAARATKRLTGKLHRDRAARVPGRAPQVGRAVGNQVYADRGESAGAMEPWRETGLRSIVLHRRSRAVRAFGDRFQRSERFATVSLLEIPDEEVYFDRRDDLTASPVQTFLELLSGDKRDQETAAQVRRAILTHRRACRK